MPMRRAVSLRTMCCSTLLVCGAALALSLAVRPAPAQAALANSAWPMFGHDARHTRRSPYVGTDSNTQKWSFVTDGYIHSSPAIGPDGQVYFGSNDTKIYALWPNGTLHWAYTTPYFVTSSPAIDASGTVYAGSYDKMYALNPNGTLKWQYYAGGDSLSSPMISPANVLYFGSTDNRLYAIDVNTALDKPGFPFTANGGITSSPALGIDGAILFTTSPGDLYAVNPNGTRKWQRTTGYFGDSSPAVAPGGTIYVGSGDSVYAYANDGTRKWVYQTGDMVRSSPALAADGTIYVGSQDGKLHAIKPDGTRKWTFAGGDMAFSSPTVDAAGNIYVGCGDTLYAIHPDGTLKWPFHRDWAFASSPSIDASGTIYAGNFNGRMYAIGGPSVPDDTTPPAGTTDLTATALDWSRVRLNWTAPGDDDATGRASADDIRYNTEPITGLNWGACALVRGEPLPKGATEDESFTVTGLPPNSRLYFALKTADEVPNWSSLSNTATARTTLFGSVKGRVTDGYGHNLVDARVRLFRGGTGVETVATSGEGIYAFAPQEMTSDQGWTVRAYLQNGATDPSDFRIVQSGTTQALTIQSTFNVYDVGPDANGVIRQDFDFSDWGFGGYGGQSSLSHWAAVYYHTQQAADFWQSRIGLTLDHELPEDVVLKRTSWDDTAYHDGFYTGNHDIHLEGSRIYYTCGNRPMNREWHEFAHHAQHDAWEHNGMASPWPRHQGDSNHGGWANHCTSDSLLEGWAEFFSCVTKDQSYAAGNTADETRSGLYMMYWGVWDLELNESYASNREEPQEELLVARLLWDLYDSNATYPGGTDDDTASMTLPQLWGLAGTYKANVHALYTAAIALPESTVTDQQVNNIFLAHGAYADWDKDGTRDSTETIGQLAESSRSDRHSTPPTPGSAIALDVETPQGADVRSLTAIVSVDYESATARDFSYETAVETSGATQIFVAMPAADTTVTIRVKNTDDVTATSAATITADGFWAARETWSHRLDSASNDVIATRSFVVPKAGSRLTVGSASPEFTTGPASSGIATVTYGGSLTVLGELDPAHPGARVKTYFRPAGSRRWSYLGSVGAVGGTVYGKTFKPTKNGTFKVYFAGDADHGASSRTAGVRVRHKVKWFGSAASVTRNARFTFRGSVSPTHRGPRVALQRLSTPGGWSTTAGTWKTVAYATVNRYGRFSGAWRPTSYGTYRMRVVFSSDSAHSFGESVRRWLHVK